MNSCAQSLYEALVMSGVKAGAFHDQAGGILTGEVKAEHWGMLAEIARRMGWRWCAVWGDDLVDALRLTVCFEKCGQYVLFNAALNVRNPRVKTHSLVYPGAGRSERHTRDLLGIQFEGSQDARRWIRHLAWGADQWPLRKDFSASPPAEAAADCEYPFLTVSGDGVYEIPVGPVHAGIIEPGHFRFQAVGEDVIRLEERLGYVHKGIEKIAEGRDAASLARLAGRVSGDSTVAHSWAACQAMERAAGLKVPERAHYLRALMAERERITNHLGDIGAICNDVGFAFAYYQFGRLKEVCCRRNFKSFGHRLLMDCVVPGGVKVDLTADDIAGILQEGRELKKELGALQNILDEHTSLDDRLRGTGTLDTQSASELGVLGYVARASCLDFDVRRAAPYEPYDKLDFQVVSLQHGDVRSRLFVRLLEINVSLALQEQILSNLPSGSCSCGWPSSCFACQGLGIVEGFRGEVISFVRFGEDGRVARYYSRDPSVLNWAALERLIAQNIVPDFPVCNKSVNGSYSGHDL